MSNTNVVPFPPPDKRTVEEVIGVIGVTHLAGDIRGIAVAILTTEGVELPFSDADDPVALLGAVRMLDAELLGELTDDED